MEFDIGTLSLIVIFGLLALISIGVPLGFASGFMGAVVVFLNIGEHALGILLSRYYSLVVTYSFFMWCIIVVIVCCVWRCVLVLFYDCVVVNIQLGCYLCRGIVNRVADCR